MKAFCAPERVTAVASPVQGFDEVGFEGEVELGRRDEGGGALKQADGGAVVRPNLRAATGGGQASPGRGGQMPSTAVPSSAW